MDRTVVARYGHDPERGGVYVEIDDDEWRLATYEANCDYDAVLGVIEILASFGFVGSDDIEAALEWLETPPEWRRGLPAGGVRRLMRNVGRLSEVARS